MSRMTLPAMNHSPIHVEDAEVHRVGLAGAAALPGIARDQELVARHVDRIEGDLEELALTGIELGVDQHPGLAALVPVFGHPVVDDTCPCSK